MRTSIAPLEEPSTLTEARAAPAVGRAWPIHRHKMRCSQEGLAVCRVWRAQSHPAAIQNRHVSPSPTDALIDLKVGCRLGRPIPVVCPVRLGRNTLTHMRIAVLPQRWPARRADVWRLRVDTEVIQNPPDSRVPSVMNVIRHIGPPHIGQSHAQRCRSPGICERLGARTPWGAVVALTVKLARTGQLQPCLEVFDYGLVERRALRRRGVACGVAPRAGWQIAAPV